MLFRSAGHHGGRVLGVPHPLLGRQLGGEGRGDGQHPGGCPRDHDLLVTPLPRRGAGLAGVGAGGRPHDGVQLVLAEVCLEVLLTVTLVHVDLEVVVAGEALVAHGTPHTFLVEGVQLVLVVHVMVLASHVSEGCVTHVALVNSLGVS